MGNIISSFELLKKMLKEDAYPKSEQKENVNKNEGNVQGDKQGQAKTASVEKGAAVDDVLSGKLKLVSLKEAEYKDIPANQIVVELFDDELQDLDLFWSKGTIFDKTTGCNRHTCKEDYLELASRIPEVYKAIESGKTIDELLQDSELEQTVLKYFDDYNMIHAVEGNGFVEMQSGGRHRILAAQELNLKIPVKIVARYQYQQFQKDNKLSASDMEHFQKGEDRNTQGLFW